MDPIFLVICTAGLCAAGIAGSLLLNLLGVVLQVIGGLVGLLFEVLGSGPIGWCGCLIVLALVVGVVLLVGYVLSVLPACGTAQAVNLCRLLGYG